MPIQADAVLIPASVNSFPEDASGVSYDIGAFEFLGDLPPPDPITASATLSSSSVSTICFGATPAQLTLARDQILAAVIQAKNQVIVAMPDISGLATKADLTAAKNEILAAIAAIPTSGGGEGTATSSATLTGWAVINGVQYAALSAAATNATPGSVVEIYGQMYDRNATAAFPNGCTIRGMTPDAKLEWRLGTAPRMALDKGLIVCTGAGQGYLIENLELCGATISSSLGANAAGVRGDAVSAITVQSCNIHDNQNGVLSVAFSQNYFGNVFKDNGNGAGNTHGIYVNSTAVSEVTVENNTFYATKEGNQFKSRAKKTTFRHNTVAELDGACSYQVDLPNGGDVLIEKNVIEQGPNAVNRNIISYGPEGIPVDGRTNSFTVQDNWIINDHALGAWGVNIFNQPTALSILRNNFVGLFTAHIQNGGILDQSNLIFADRAAAGLVAYPALPEVPV